MELGRKAMFNPQRLVGEVLDGKYRLAAFLGEGSFGWVYSADWLVEGRARSQCAIKIVRPKSPDQREGVWRELDVLSQLSHPGLVQFRTAFAVSEGDLAGAICLVMELCGETLEARLQADHGMEAGEVRGVARDLAEVLAWLHGQNVVHRGLKPANVFRARDSWKLGDLGLVSASGLKGSPLYLAPEVMDTEVGPALDVWALGVLLQESLTGVLAYEAPSEAALYGALLIREPTIAPNLPPPFDAIVRGCLVKDPQARWTAVQVLEALSGATRQPAPPSPPVPSPAPLSPPPLVQVDSPSLSPTVPRGLVALGCNAQGRERFQVVEGSGPVLVSLPAGRFVMGSPASEDGRYRGETRHEVILNRGFLLGEAPVTQAEYAAVVGTNPSHFQGWDCPVEQVTWFDAVSFCNSLSRRVGLEEAYVVHKESVIWKGLSCPGFRLPTEAEWEYACRAGTTGARYGDLDAVAWYAENSGDSTHPVRQKQPNPWGLHDILGNVWEWCWDRHGDYPPGVLADPLGPDSGSLRVFRGGSWFNVAQFARAAYRNYYVPESRLATQGFRLARSLP
jgi:formylglycine-generating enzyme required for sulfatase activity